MDDKKISFAPFHAINQFMVPEYRQSVIQVVLGSMDRLNQDKRNTFVNLIKKWVKIPGFRNSMAAPVPVKLKGAVSAFEKNPEFAIQTLACWAEINSELAQNVYQLLTKRNWEILPIEADRTKLPGFMTEWHPSDQYEVLNQTFKEMFPESQVSENDVRLMVVWLSTRLPYDAVDVDGEDLSYQTNQ